VEIQPIKRVIKITIFDVSASSGEEMRAICSQNHLDRRGLGLVAKRMMTKLILGFAVGGVAGSVALAVDWAQYRGPNHDGSSPEKILDQWPSSGLHPVWTAPLTAGFSSMSLGGGKAFTLVQRQVDGVAQEVCVALDASSGKELWAAPLGVAKYDKGGDTGTSDNNGGDGPRSTPSVDDGRVYALSARLVLSCLGARSGKVLWQKDLIKEYAGRNIGWQNAASPLIDGNLVFVGGGGPGQSMLAFNKTNGNLVWKAHDEKITHASPVAATILGVRQIIFFMQSGLVSVKPEDGAVLWRYPFRYSVSTAASPVVSGDIVYCSAGYGVGASACRVTKTDEGFKATQLWFKPAKELNNHWSTPVCRDGYIYGLFGFKEFGKCPLKCVELATGKEMWSKDGFGPGNCLWVDGKLVVLSDAGDVVLVKASPDGYTELGRTHAVAGKCWSSPALANGRLYVRSTKEGACLELAR
jgi:outer membrane protein assembly factor BamB